MPDKNNKQEIESNYGKAESLFEKKDYNSAIVYLNKILELEPDNLKALYKRAIAYYNSWQDTAAIADLTRYLQFDPKNTEALSKRGTCYYSQRKYDDASADFRRVLELDPKNSTALNELGIIHYDKREYDQAIEFYNNALKNKPDMDVACNNLGLCYYYKGDYGAAIENFTRAVQINPKYAKAYYWRGVVYYYKNDYDKAIIDYQKAIESDQKYAEPYCDIGLIYYNKKDYEKAIENYNMAILLNPVFSRAYFNRSLVYYYYKNNPNSALSDLIHAISSDPAYARAYDQRGVVYEQLGNIEQAKADYKKALELDPLLREARKALDRLESKPTVSSNAPEEGPFNTIIPDTDFSKVAGMADLKEHLKFSVIEPLKNPELAKKYKRKIGGGLILYGPPGCGKTYIIRALAGETKMKIIIIKVSDILDKWIGNSEKNLHTAFEIARKNAPCIIFLDELDGLGWRRIESEHSWERSMIAQLLTEMDNVDKKNENIIIVGATNAPWFIDDALKRSGRFGKLIYVSPPDAKSREALFRAYLKGIPIDKNINYKKFAEQTWHFSCADVQSVCETAAEMAYTASIKNKGKEIPVSNVFIETAIKKERSDITEWLTSLNRMLGEEEMREFYPEMYEDLLKMRQLYGKKISSMGSGEGKMFG